MTFLWYLVINFWLLLLGRRFLECLLFERTLVNLKLRRQAALNNPTDDSWPFLIVLIPLFREQALLEQILEHFSHLEYPQDRIQIVLITTQKEKTDGQTTKEQLEEIYSQRRYKFLHLHYPRWHQFRAVQLNFTLEKMKIGKDTCETFIGVYNADSLPDIDSLIILAKDAILYKRRNGEFPFAYQQPVRYFVPLRNGKRNEVMSGAAAFQTMWTIAHFVRRLLKAEESVSADKEQPYTRWPVGLLGHGEFIRLDVLKKVGGFPHQAYGDGLLLGWVLVIRGFPIRLLPAFEHCAVPPHSRALIRQHEAWFLALWNLGVAVRLASTAKSEKLDKKEVSRFVLQRVLASAAWGLRSVVIVLMLLVGIFVDISTCLLGLVGVVGYATIPSVFLTSRHSSLASVYPSMNEASLSTILTRLAASVPALFVDGAGFWVLVGTRIMNFGRKIVPDKTER